MTRESNADEIPPARISAFVERLSSDDVAGTMSARVFSPSDAKGGVEPVADKTAIVFIEYQNEFTTDGGKIAAAEKTAPSSSPTPRRSQLPP